MSSCNAHRKSAEISLTIDSDSAALGWGQDSAELYRQTIGYHSFVLWFSHMLQIVILVNVYYITWEKFHNLERACTKIENNTRDFIDEK